jgi:hypothetical protein
MFDVFKPSVLEILSIIITSVILIYILTYTITDAINRVIFKYRCRTMTFSRMLSEEDCGEEISDEEYEKMLKETEEK